MRSELLPVCLFLGQCSVLGALDSLQGKPLQMGGVFAKLGGLKCQNHIGILANFRYGGQGVVRGLTRGAIDAHAQIRTVKTEDDVFIRGPAHLWCFCFAMNTGRIHAVFRICPGCGSQPMDKS
jgi:hypothetical protein